MATSQSRPIATTTLGVTVGGEAERALPRAPLCLTSTRQWSHLTRAFHPCLMAAAVEVKKIETMMMMGTRAVLAMSPTSRCKLTALSTCTCVGIHSGRAESASAIELTTSRAEALQARRSCASSLETFTQSFLHRAWLKTRGPERGSKSALIVVAYIFSWPPFRLHHV